MQAIKAEKLSDIHMTKFQTPRGTRDFLPGDMMKRQFILDTARNVFERWGFDPLETPAFEEFELLTAKGGAAIRDEIYYFRDKSDRELGLRFDFTVPTCRVLASANLPKPFRRYQIGPVWRYDRPGSGRYREFWQADVDIFGSSSIESDAEVVACACEVLRKIGLSNFFVRINNRKIMNAFFESLNINAMDAMRSVDKLNKIGEDGVREELKSKKVDEDKIDSIIKFTRNDDIEKIRKAVNSDSVEELEKLSKLLKMYGVPFRIDMSLVRGLEYYTGSVFEIMQEGSNLTITAGGRYDNMVEGFGGKPTPAVGISLGIDRLVDFIQLELGRTKTTIYVAPVNENVREKAIEISSELRSLGLNVECDVMSRPLGKQLEYVNAKGIRFSIVVGENELKSSVVKLRNMETGSEKEVELKNLKRVADIVNSG